MIVVGKQLKGPKGWCVVRDKLTGQVFCGYDTEVYSGDYERVKKFADEMKAAFDTYGGKTFVRPSMPTVRYERGCPIWDLYYKEQNEWSIWERARRLANLDPFDYGPVFRAKLTFVGHSRGRSSVTMNFKDENDFPVIIGPCGIDMFIKAVSDGKITVGSDGRFLMQFIFTKKGANVYAEPFYEKFGPLEEGKEELK